MGACCSTTSDKTEKERKSYKHEIKTHQNNNEDSVEAGRKYKVEKKNENNNINKLLETGDLRAIDFILSNGNDINEFIFESNTENLILAAVRTTNNPELIHSIINKGGYVDSEQTENGYTPLVGACLDLKQELVKALLQHNPKFTFYHKESKEKKEVIVFIREFLIEHKFAKKSALTPEQKAKYDNIIEMLKDYKYRNADVQQLDEEKKKFNPRQSGNMDRL